MDSIIEECAVQILRMRAHQLLMDLVNNQLTCFHPELTLSSGQWFPDGEARSISGPPGRGFRSFRYYKHNSTSNQDKARVNVGFVKSGNDSWQIRYLQIHIGDDETRYFRFVRKRWTSYSLPGYSRKNLVQSAEA